DGAVGLVARPLRDGGRGRTGRRAARGRRPSRGRRGGGGGRTRKRPAGERTVDEPHLALRYREGVADVAGAVPVDVARLGVRELATWPEPQHELGRYERIAVNGTALR